MVIVFVSGEGRNLRFAGGGVRAVRAILLVLCCALVSFACPAGSQERAIKTATAVPVEIAPTRKRVALVIGNTAYRSLVPLPNAINDASDVCAALKSIGFRTTCLADVTTRRQLREAIQTFAADAAAGAETFFFYAGHGIQSNGENYLIPTEAQILTEADIDYEGVGVGYLLQSLEQARSYPNVIILDACRDNPFGRNARFRVEKGLARLDPPIGTVLAYATAPNKTALDGTGRNGLFTKHLLSRMTEFGIQLDEMLRQVAKGVEDEARSAYRVEQVPYRSSSYSASYCLAGCDDPKLQDRVKEIEAQRNELNHKLEQMSVENARLKAQAQSGADEITRLEQHISRLTADETTKGASNSNVRLELERARSELAAMKFEQTRRDTIERENQKRMTELEGLRAELQRQAAEIDEYRRKIRELEISRERSRGLDDSSQPSRDAPRKPAVIVPSF